MSIRQRVSIIFISPDEYLISTFTISEGLIPFSKSITLINSDPSIAYLMLQNEFYLQVLIMAHCVGHSDFFKNNRCFKETDAKNVVSKMTNDKLMNTYLIK